MYHVKAKIHTAGKNMKIDNKTLGLYTRVMQPIGSVG